MIAERLEKATPENWMFPPPEGWTFDQVKDLTLPFDWDLVDGAIVVRGRALPWHNKVRSSLEQHLGECLVEPFGVLGEQCVLIDEYNPPVPDVVVFNARGFDLLAAEYVPVEKAVLLVEVVSPGSRQDDRVRKPAMYAAAGVRYYWRVERGDDGMPEVHEFWLPVGKDAYIPAPLHPVHRGKLETEVPFPVAIDLANLLKF
ncbi:Uma2 family endonuclease [Streptomyces luteosporeus]|uniref:Uma2 family endonuclease n=2 Tax=Streptomyces TaxID=1883 RepID=A0ABN3U2Z1_9ACTN